MNEIEALAEEFSSCRKMLIALGDENRCHLILEMMKLPMDQRINHLKLGNVQDIIFLIVLGDIL